MAEATRNPADRLDSWKEIAVYLRRGARTVQRWEREEGLPVHRLLHDQGSTVYAYKSELEAWWSRRRSPDAPEPPAGHEFGRSVAVLPFTDMSREKDQEYFCEGIAEEILNSLSRVKRLRVASRTAAFQFKAAADPREIGRRLHVSTLLEGSVRKSGSRLRIAVQLTHAAGGYQLWAARYEREMSDIFAIQDEIARNIAGALELTLTAEERGALRAGSTTDVEAYDCYLRGRKFYYRYTRREVEFALQLFARAVELDPAYAAAQAGLADCSSYIYLYSKRTEEVRRQAEAASRRAVELNPKSAQAQASRALALSLGGCDADAEQAFETAIALDPGLFEARYFYARHAFVRGASEKAVRLYEEAMRVRPEDYQSPLLVAQIYDDLGRPADARASRERGVRIAAEHLQLNPDDVRALYMAANGMVALGQRERGREWVERALLMQPDDPMVLYNVGCIYAMLGMREQAIDCEERAVHNGLTQKGWLEHDSNLDPLRGEPRFQTLLRSLE